MSFHARAGEITGIAGLVGCGKSEIDPRHLRAGDRLTDGRDPCRRRRRYAIRRRRRVLKRGLAIFPSDRVAEGLALGRPMRENASMAALDLPTFARRGVLQRGERAARDPVASSTG